MELEQSFLILFSVATAVSIAARRIQVPYTVALVVVGILLGSTHTLQVPHLTKDLLFALILPGLVFEAAFHIDIQKFWANAMAIHALAVPGLLVAIGLTSAILSPAVESLHVVEGFGMVQALVFAALIAATDPIAVVGLFKSLGAPKRLAVLVEGESLLNDGTGVVVFTMVLAYAGGKHATAGEAIVEFLRVAGLGAAVGAIFGYVVSRIVEQIDDPMVELTLTVIAAYGSFVAAEKVHLSGVMATVAAGMLCGNFGARTGMSPTTRVAVETFWEYVAFALNSVVFLLIGFEVSLPSLAAAWNSILVAYLAVMIGRAGVVFPVAALLSRTRERISWAWSMVVFWAGLRGALSMVLVLGLPREFVHRELLVNMTFGVVLVSILLQGLTMAPVLRYLGVVGPPSREHEEYELVQGRLRAGAAALEELGRLSGERTVPSVVREALRAEYESRVQEADARLHGLHMDAVELREEAFRSVRRRLLLAERAALVRAAHEGALGSHALEALLAEVDTRIEGLELIPTHTTSQPPRAQAS